MAIATISPDDFSIERTFQFDDLNIVASAASGNKKWLLLHNLDTGTLTVGLINPNFSFYRYKFLPARHIQPLALPVSGRRRSGLSDAERRRFSKVVIGFAQVLSDGTFVEWWRTTLDIPYPRNIVGLKDAHAWYENDYERGRGTVYIFDVKHAQMLSTRAFDREINAIIVDGERVCLYTRTRFDHRDLRPRSQPPTRQREIHRV